MTGSCEYGNKFSRSVKGRNFLFLRRPTITVSRGTVLYEVSLLTMLHQSQSYLVPNKVTERQTGESAGLISTYFLKIVLGRLRENMIKRSKNR